MTTLIMASQSPLTSITLIDDSQAVSASQDSLPKDQLLAVYLTEGIPYVKDI